MKGIELCKIYIQRPQIWKSKPPALEIKKAFVYIKFSGPTRWCTLLEIQLHFPLWQRKTFCLTILTIKLLKILTILIAKRFRWFKAFKMILSSQRRLGLYWFTLTCRSKVLAKCIHRKSLSQLIWQAHTLIKNIRTNINFRTKKVGLKFFSYEYFRFRIIQVNVQITSTSKVYENTQQCDYPLDNKLKTFLFSYRLLSSNCAF